jgi:hypothetical protein
VAYTCAIPARGLAFFKFKVLSCTRTNYVFTEHNTHIVGSDEHVGSQLRMCVYTSSIGGASRTNLKDWLPCVVLIVAYLFVNSFSFCRALQLCHASFLVKFHFIKSLTDPPRYTYTFILLDRHPRTIQCGEKYWNSGKDGYCENRKIKSAPIT